MDDEAPFGMDNCRQEGTGIHSQKSISKVHIFQTLAFSLKIKETERWKWNKARFKKSKSTNHLINEKAVTDNCMEFFTLFLNKLQFTLILKTNTKKEIVKESYFYVPSTIPITFPSQ